MGCYHGAQTSVLLCTSDMKPLVVEGHISKSRLYEGGFCDECSPLLYKVPLCCSSHICDKISVFVRRCVLQLLRLAGGNRQTHINTTLLTEGYDLTHFSHCFIQLSAFKYKYILFILYCKTLLLLY